MTNEEAVEITQMLDEVIRNRRGAALFPGGVPTSIALVWIQEVEKLPDPEIATRAVADIYVASMERPPTPRDLKDAYRNIETSKRAKLPTLPEPEFIRELPIWLKGWVVARAAGDMRAWPDQKEGFDALQLHNPFFRTFVWTEQELMPEKERQQYERQGGEMSAAKMALLLTKIASENLPKP